MATITLSYAVGVDYRTADAEVTDAGDIAYVELNGRAFIRCTGGALVAVDAVAEIVGMPEPETADEALPEVREDGEKFPEADPYAGEPY